MVGLRRWVMAVSGRRLLACLLAIDAAVLAFLPGDSKVYARSISEVVAAPAHFRDRTVRVHGTIAPGSLRQRAARCDYSFRLQGHDGAELAVRWPFSSPDGLSCDARVCENPLLSFSVQGELARAPSGKIELLAHSVIARCPGKYEVQPDGQRHLTCPPIPVVP